MDLWFLSAAAGSIGKQTLSENYCSCHSCCEIISDESSFTSRSSQKRKLSQDVVIEAGECDQMGERAENQASSRILEHSCSCVVDVSKPLGRCRSHLQIKHLHKAAIKPFSSMDISVLAHLYNEQDEPRSSFPSPSGFKPSNVLHRADVANIDSLKTLSKLEAASPKPKIRAAPRKRKCQSTRNATSLFSIGMCAGFLSSLAAARKEIDDLRSSLKQAEQLVQDLQEELEMKDSFTVKELIAESNKTDTDTRVDTAGGESSVSMSKIEAELEAELERLGLNMGTSQVGDAYPACNNGEYSGRSDVSSFDSLNYAVSPTELCIRLHEVANELLEERVRVLEAAMEKKSHPAVVHESDSDVSPFDWFDRMSCELDGTDASGALSFVDNFLEDDVTPVKDDVSPVEDDVDEKELIKLLVEKTKKGSPIVLNAQRLLFSV